MMISTKDWLAYINKLALIDKTAAAKMQAYVQKHGFGDTQALIDYAYGIATKYGEGSAALAAEMYDVIAELSGKHVPPAEVAPTPEYDEVAKAVNGTAKYRNTELVSNAVGRLVKRTGVDTTMKNAIRDGAEWAWIPHGDTCAFCLTLASRGWQKASKAALKGGHAEHIHAHCDCTYAISFDGKPKYESYDPNKYLEMYENAEGSSSKDKINALRRELRKDPVRRDKINAQKRKAYKNDKMAKHKGRGYDVTKEYFEDSTPKRGLIDYEEGFDKDNRPDEVRTAKIIHEQLGGDIILKAEKAGQKNPDYEWMGALWDLKTTTTEKAANSAVKSGMKQIRTNPGGVILNYEDNDFSMDELISVIDKRMVWYPNECADIMIISKGKIIKVLRY